MWFAVNIAVNIAYGNLKIYNYNLPLIVLTKYSNLNDFEHLRKLMHTQFLGSHQEMSDKSKLRKNNRYRYIFATNKPR